ncbi:Pal1 cell morphology [Penicillium cf. griseofulvum]|uniref:Pal1 cell morphology n=1 Tax=Penicillium cf. griseofulvum TaxID=2972120 RepID=A0A9W9N1D3_9EURO|nr:Pal1 cell morphology [Penicillium cf. griseofulvum]KAJ5422726.1 Pal1 cell morphology [Penicillium cf. griseofulvum]KAJ5428902.1 Pal1 cell morphology [Penicillium cf. griseofulvum]
MNATPALRYTPGVSLAPQEHQASPTAASFGSNNPFRNRALSPSVAGSVSSNRPERPRSTNPFLDDTEALSPQSAPGMSTGASMISPIEKTDISSSTRELFESLSLKPAPQSNRPQPASDAAQRTSSNHNRPSRERSERPPGRSAPKMKDPLDIFADPPTLSQTAKDKAPRRPRRNSESSVMDRSSKLLDLDDDEKRRRERRREREGRSKDGKSRSGRKDRRLDIIDKLDVTSIYGTGMFHHDGPFDACNPHRNRRGVRTAPMQAFPKGSTNMALGGTGPNNSNIDLNLFHGRMEEGHNDFSTAARRNPETAVIDPTARVDPIHGPQSMGLGTSTFLDGAPASRSAMARRQSENEGTPAANGGGLARKKSLAQRLRGRAAGPGRINSPTDNFPPPPPQVNSSHSTSARSNERNPYFQEEDEYEEEWDKKGSSIEARIGGGRLRSSSSPKQTTGLERKTTNDRPYEESKLNPGGGFLNRMKSLRKPKPERRTSD